MNRLQRKAQGASELTRWIVFILAIGAMTFLTNVLSTTSFNEWLTKLCFVGLGFILGAVYYRK